MSAERWYRCGTGAAACPRAQSGEAFCIKDAEYDEWKCPHSKFCKDKLISVSWLYRHPLIMPGLTLSLLLLVVGGVARYYFNRPPSPIPSVTTIHSQPTPSTVVLPPFDPPREPNPPLNENERIQNALRDILRPSTPKALSLLHIQKFYFDANQSKLDAKLKPYIDEVVKELSKPEYKDKHLTVVGFADATGTDYINCPLSMSRANTVAQELRNRGIPQTITALGLCSERPIGNNATAEGQQMNRRVELWTFNIE